MASSVGGTVRPSILAVWALMMSSNFDRLYHRQVGRSGSSPQDAACIDAELTPCISDVGSVAHQPADFGDFARGPCDGNRVARCHCRQLNPPAVEEAVGADEQGIGALAHKCRKCRIDLAAGAGVEDRDLQSHGASSRSHPLLRVRPPDATLAGLTSTATREGSGYQLAQQLQPLCHQLGIEKIDAGQVAARLGEAGDKATPDRVFGDREYDGDGRGRRLDGQRRRFAGRDDDRDLPANQLGRRAPATDLNGSPPSGRRPPGSRPRHSRSPSGRGGMRAGGRANGSADWLKRNPITGIAACCACAASGHAAATPPGELA